MSAIQRDAASDEARGKQPRFKSNRPRASRLSVRDVGRTMRRDELKSLGIERVECESAVVLAHLQAFLQTFVHPDSRLRAASLLKREGWTPRFTTFVMERLDGRLCKMDEDQSRPARWPAQFLRQGVLIDSPSLGLQMSLEQASSTSLARRRDALFSIEIGRLAVFFNHEWGVWYCSAPNKPKQPTGAPSGAGG